jgi:hypothetical protein
LADAGPTLAGASIIDVISMLEHCIAERNSPMEPPYLGKKVRDLPKQRRSRKVRSVPIVAPATYLIHARHLLTMALNGVLQGLSKKHITKDLARWMVRRSRQSSASRVTLVSTNYDAAVERCVFDLVAKKGSKQRHLKVARRVDFGFTWRDVSGNRHGHLPDASLAVFKLHGSLNWLRCETCGHVTINTTERIVSLDAWQVQNQYNSCECGGLLKSLLVTPSIVRNIRDPSLLAIWNAALEDLRLADQWIFIGYSLPSEDVAIRSLLLRAFHTRKNRKRLRVQVVSFESDEPAAPLTPQAAFRMFFPRSHFPETAYEAGGVEEFVGRLRVRGTRRVIAAHGLVLCGSARRYRWPADRRQQLRPRSAAGSRAGLVAEGGARRGVYRRRRRYRVAEFQSRGRGVSPATLDDEIRLGLDCRPDRAGQR